MRDQKKEYIEKERKGRKGETGRENYIRTYCMTKEYIFNKRKKMKKNPASINITKKKKKDRHNFM